MAILSLGFLGWSLIHHLLDKSLHSEVVIEYLLTVALVLIIMYSFLI